MQKYLIEFADKKHGICISANSWEEAKSIAENPENWQDHKSPKVCYIAAIYNNAPDYTCYKI